MLVAVFFFVSLVAAAVKVNIGQAYIPGVVNSNVANNFQFTDTGSPADNADSIGSHSPASRVKSAVNHRYNSPFNFWNSHTGYNRYWNPYHRRQRSYLVCPNETTVHDDYQLSSDYTGYPETRIAQEFVINPASPCLQRLNLPQNISTKPETTITSGATKLCMEVQRRLWSYQSRQYNMRCWVMNNYQQPVIYGECPNSLNNRCSKCNTKKQSTHYGYTDTRRKKCFRVYNYIFVMAYCDGLDTGHRFVIERIVIPTHCACAEVTCSKHLILQNPPSDSLPYSWPFNWPF